MRRDSVKMMSHRQGEELFALQVFGHQVVEPGLVGPRLELSQHRDAPGVFDVGLDLAAQRAFAEGADAVAQRLEAAGLAQVAELLAEAVQVAKHALVDEADQPVEFQQRVL